MAKRFKSFEEIVKFSSTYAKESTEFDCRLQLEVDGVTYNAYTVAVAYRDLMFYTDSAIITYDVNQYGSEFSALIRDIVIDE